ncbi:hypothetical protein BSLG_000286 [Batrachochytrium salamandrivorans]|nr:hypothetical protein BSLG_000286 [Batrachochytrium salamandrivorans]
MSSISLRTVFGLAMSASLALAANIADTVKANPKLTKMAAMAGSNPKWASSPNGTLLVPSDAALAAANLPAGSHGFVFAVRTIDHRVRPNYQVVDDDTTSIQIIFDNYTPGDVRPEIHVRFGTGATLASEQIQADNGWIYILDAPIPAAQPPSQVLPAQSCTMFAKALQDSGIMPYLDSLTGYTLIAPNNAAFTAASARLSAMTPDQLRATLLYHMLPTKYVSTLLNPGSVPSQLAGNTVSIAVTGESASFGGAKLTLADVFSANGVVHIVDAVMTPPTPPTGAVAIPASPSSPATTTAGAATQTTTANGAGSASSAAAPGATATNRTGSTASTNSADTLVSAALGPAVAGFIAALVL